MLFADPLMTQAAPANPPSKALQLRHSDTPGGDSRGGLDASDLGQVRTMRDVQRAHAALERLEADQQLVLALQLNGFDPQSEEWVRFRRVLLEYGYSVLKAWACTGMLRTMAAKALRGQGLLGLNKLPEGLKLTSDEAHELVTELLITSVERFRTKSLAHPDPTRRWRPDGGASLTTFFIGRCLLDLPDEYARWQRQRRRPQPIERLANDAAMHNTEHAALDRIAANEFRAGMQARTLAIVEYDSQGYSDKEIAHLLTVGGEPTSEAAVRTVLSRVRATYRKTSS